MTVRSKLKPLRWGSLAFFLLLFTLAITSIAFAETFYWVKKADMPTARWRATSGVVDGKIFVLGGTTGASYPPSGVTGIVEMYDPATDSWESKPSLSAPRFAAGSATQGNYIYIAGGGSTDGGPGLGPPTIENTILRYDTSSGTSSIVGYLSGPRFRNSCVIVGDKLYVPGGNDFSAALDTIEVFDLTLGEVVGTITLPAARDNMAAVSLGTKIYMFGGNDADSNPTNTCWELNTANNTITEKSPMPFTKSGYKGAHVTSDNKIIVTGALYDPAADTWEIKSLENRFDGRSPVVARIGDNVYRIGGKNSDEQVLNTTMHGAKHESEGDYNVTFSSSGGEQSLSCGSHGAVSVSLPSGTYVDDILAVNVLSTGPAALSANARSKYFNITTTAGFTGSVIVKVPYNEASVTGSESDLKLYHWDGSAWEDITVSVDTENNTVSGVTSSFSPFVVGEEGSSSPSSSSVPPSSIWSLAFMILSALVIVRRSLGSNIS